MADGISGGYRPLGIAREKVDAVQLLVFTGHNQSASSKADQRGHYGSVGQEAIERLNHPLAGFGNDRGVYAFVMTSKCNHLGREQGACGEGVMRLHGPSERTRRTARWIFLGTVFQVVGHQFAVLLAKHRILFVGRNSGCRSAVQ